MKFALIGCGLWGAVILRDLVQLGNQVSVIELDSQNAADALSLGAERTWKELKDITNVDAVIIATPASTHAEIIHALDAMGNMLPIFCEKPLVDSSAHARGLLLRSGPPLFVMHTWRYHPGVEMLAGMIQTNEFGSLCAIHSIRANWTSPRIDVDPVWTLLPHDLSILLEFFGVMPEPVSAEAEYHGNKVVGLKCHLNINGVKIWITVSTRQILKQRELQLHFNDGVAIMPDDSQGCIQILRNEQTMQQVEKRYYNSDESALQKELRIFCDYLGGGEEPKCSAKTGMTIINMIEQILRLAGIDK